MYPNICCFSSKLNKHKHCFSTCMDNTICRMVHLAPCNTEHGNFHTSLWSLVQLPNLEVPSVFVSSLKQLFLFLGTENLLQHRNSVKVILDSSVVCIHQSKDQDGGTSIPLHYLYILLLHVGITTIM